MKKLKNIVIGKVNKILKLINDFFTKGEGEFARNFRIIILLVWVNILGFFILSNAGFFTVLNPFKFFNLMPNDKRKEITLFYPGSIDELHEKSGSTEKTRIVELRQKTEFNDDYKSPGREQRFVINAKMILQQLMTSPDSIRGVTAIKDMLMVKSVWYFDDQLIVHLDGKKIALMSESQSSLMISCIQKSLHANLGAFVNIKIVK
jgi:hypothetical protein